MDSRERKRALEKCLKRDSDIYKDPSLEMCKKEHREPAKLLAED